MSYVEHGPRIFLAGRPNTGIPLIYGDYVLPRKRTEGRLKLHDSCSDIRAWSPNSLENSRYFRELTEHASPAGKIIPFNVVLENIIGLTSQAQNELYSVKRELQKYKSLRLTPDQEEQLKSISNSVSATDQQRSNDSLKTLRADGTLVKDALLDISKSNPTIHHNSCLSIRIPSRGGSANNKKDGLYSTIQNDPLDSYSFSALDANPLLNNNYNLLFPLKSGHGLSFVGDFSGKCTRRVECTDVASQAEQETREIGVQFNDEDSGSAPGKVTSISTTSQTSLIYKSSDEEISVTERDKCSLQTSNCEERSSECDLSCDQDFRDIRTLSQSSSIAGTECDFDIADSTHKEVIIEKDSEIIVLKNELCVRDAELEELRDLNRNLETLLKEREESLRALQNNLKVSQEQLVRIDHQRNYEMDDLKKKLYAYKCLTEELKEDLNKRCQDCYLQSQELEKLRVCAKEAAALRTENDSLLIKLKDMQHLSKEAESCNLALEQLKSTLREKEKLKMQNREQSCMLADQEDEIKRLLVLISQMSVPHNQQVTTEECLENLRTEIQNRDIKISQYEERLLSLKLEVSDFFNTLRNSLNNLEEFHGVYEDTCSCTQCDIDIGEEANNVLYNINVMMTRFQSYKIERQDLLQQIKTLKNISQSSKQIEYSNPCLNWEDTSDHDLYYGCKYERGDVVKKDSVIILSVRQNKNNVSEEEDDNLSNSINSDNSLNITSSNLNTCGFKKDSSKRTVKLSTQDSTEEIERAIIDQVSRSLIKVRSLIQKLQVYIEIERPSLIRQIRNFYDALKDAELAINCSQDILLRKQRISEMYNQYKEGYKKYKHHIKYLPNDLHKVQIKINESIEAILRRQLKEILWLEKKNLQDEQINRALETYLRTFIDRMNMALRGAGDQHIHIVEKMEKQQEELERKNTEISRLKHEVTQMGDGDILTQEQIKQNAVINEQLLQVTKELNDKNVLLLKLQEQLRISEDKLSACSKDCSALKKENKNLDNVRNRLSKEREENKEELMMKNKEIMNLSEQLRDFLEAKDLMTTMEDKMKEMEKKLDNLQSENDQLRNEVKLANAIISKKKESIRDFKNTIDRSEKNWAHKIIEHNTAMQGKHTEIAKLKSENKSLKEKLKDIENKLSGMNATILSLTQENDKINMIYVLQEDLTKLDKSERKLKTDLGNLKTQLINDQDTNKKLENKLNAFLLENETLRKNIDYWKGENSQLSLKLCGDIAGKKSRDELFTLPKKICEKLSMLKHQLNIKTACLTNYSNKMQQNEFLTNNIYRGEKLELIMDEVNQGLKSGFECRKEAKENAIEEVQREEQHVPKNADSRDTISADSYVSFDEFGSSENSPVKLRHKLKCLENENKAKQHEIEKLLADVEARDAAIKSLEESVHCLIQENTDLRAVLKSQVEEYQDKLTLMKKNYDSSLNALCERHKESVETLQKRFEDTISGERCPFDSESWLQSLSMKELKELHDRLCMSSSCVVRNKSGTIHIKDENQYLYQNDVEKDQLYPSMKELGRKIRTTGKHAHEKHTANELTHILRCKEQTLNKNLTLHSREQDDLHQNQWHFSTPNKHFKFPSSEVEDYESNFKKTLGMSDSERTQVELKNKNGLEKHGVENITFDKQRWNFINQCSAYHKLSSTY